MVQRGHSAPVALGDQSDEDLSEVNERHHERERDHHEEQKLLVKPELSDVGEDVVEVHLILGVGGGGLFVGTRGWRGRLVAQVGCQVTLRVSGHGAVQSLLCTSSVSVPVPVPVAVMPVPEPVVYWHERHAAITTGWGPALALPDPPTTIILCNK